MREALCTAIINEPDMDVAAEVVSGAEALTQLPALQPDVILISVGNPGTEEIRCITALRQARPNVPIVALTTNEVEEHEQATLQAGAQVVLTKAAPRAELLHVLRALRKPLIPPKQEASAKIP